MSRCLVLFVIKRNIHLYIFHIFHAVSSGRQYFLMRGSKIPEMSSPSWARKFLAEFSTSAESHSWSRFAYLRSHLGYSRWHLARLRSRFLRSHFAYSHSHLCLFLSTIRYIRLYYLNYNYSWRNHYLFDLTHA